MTACKIWKLALQRKCKYVVIQVLIDNWARMVSEYQSCCQYTYTFIFLQSIRSVMKELNQLCTVYSVTSVAIPPLGVGRMYQYDPTEAASYMRDYILKYLPAIKVCVILILL